MIQEIHLYILCGLFGAAVHILLKYQRLHSAAVAGNVVITLPMYLKMDWVGMILTVLPIGIWYLTFGEVANKYHDLHNYMRISFVGVGMSGAYFLQKLDNNMEKYINKIIDAKTDIADSLAEPIQDSEEPK